MTKLAFSFFITRESNQLKSFIHPCTYLLYTNAQLNEHIYSPTKAETQDRQTDMYMDKKEKRKTYKNITELLSAMNIFVKT